MTICRQLSKMNIFVLNVKTLICINSDKQAEKATNLCKKLANLLYISSCCLVLDDEKYFTYDGSNMQGTDNYYTNDISKCPDSVRFVGKEKYAKN